MSLVPCPPPNPTKHNACQVDKSHRTTKEHETSILASSQIFITALILLNHISFSHVFLWPLDAEYLHNYQTFILLLSLTSSYTEYSGLGLVWNLSLRYSLGNTQPGRSPWNNGFWIRQTRNCGRYSNPSVLSKNYMDFNSFSALPFSNRNKPFIT